MRQIALLLVFASALSVQAQKVTLRINPKAGTTYNYSLVTTMKSTGMMASETKQTMNSTMKVLSNAGGKVTLQTSVSGAKVTGTGMMAQMAPQMEKMLNSMNVTSTVDALGHPVNLKTTPNNPIGGMMGNMAGGMSGLTMLPKEPVGVGSTWSSNLDLSKVMSGAMSKGMKMGGGNMPIKMTLKRFENRAGKRTAVIEMLTKGTVTFDMGGMMGGAGGAKPAGGTKGSTTIDSKATIWLELATGIPLETSTHSTNQTNFGGMKMSQVSDSVMKLK